MCKNDKDCAEIDYEGVVGDILVSIDRIMNIQVTNVERDGDEYNCKIHMPSVDEYKEIRKKMCPVDTVDAGVRGDQCLIH